MSCRTRRASWTGCRLGYCQPILRLDSRDCVPLMILQKIQLAAILSEDMQYCPCCTLLYWPLSTLKLQLKRGAGTMTESLG